jgi:hypothetical protein
VGLNHRFFKGNHDGYNVTDSHELGDYGFCGLYTFFVRGAYSIDKLYRTVGVDWFENEELSFRQMSLAIEEYGKSKPRIMLSHDCPQSVCEELFGYTDKPITRQGLQIMLDIHKPDLWVFGHHHISKNIRIGSTDFVCLKELETMEI